MLLKSEGGKTKIPTNVSIQDWDCTALFQSTLYAQTFTLPDSKGYNRTLNDLYLKRNKPTSGSFHSAVASPTGDQNETIALAVDQLRLLRNTLCHSSNPCISKTDLDIYIQYAKEAFTAVNVSALCLEAIKNLAESDFPTARVQQLEDSIKMDRDVFFQFLENGIMDKVDSANERIALVQEITGREFHELGRKIDELKEAVKG